MAVPGKPHCTVHVPALTVSTEEAASGEPLRAVPVLAELTATLAEATSQAVPDELPRAVPVNAHVSVDMLTAVHVASVASPAVHASTVPRGTTVVASTAVHGESSCAMPVMAELTAVP